DRKDRVPLPHQGRERRKRRGLHRGRRLRLCLWRVERRPRSPRPRQSREDSMTYEQLGFEEWFRRAMAERRRAIHRLRMGDRLDHKERMHGALFFLRLARGWKPKHSYREAAE